MPGQKFIQHDGAGGLAETEATQAGGAGSANKIPALDAGGRIDQSMMPTGIGADTESLVAYETIAANGFVNVFDDGGTPSMRNTDATTQGREAHGFVKSAVSAGAVGLVFFEGNNDGVSGATTGPVYLSTTAGGFTSTPPSASGNVVQMIGIATGPNNINFERQTGLVLA